MPNGPLISYTAPGPGVPATPNARWEVQYMRLPDGSNTTPQTSEPSCCEPVRRISGDTARSEVISPISMLPPSSHTSTSPRGEMVTLSTASSDESLASSRSNSTSIRFLRMS